MLKQNCIKNECKNISKTRANSVKLRAFSDSALPIKPQNDSTFFAFFYWPVLFVINFCFVM